jgi:hypothetical protein
VHSVEIDSLTLARPRTVGVEALGLWVMAQVDFIALLERLGLTGLQRAAIVGVIVGRMAAPGSELATQRWLCERSALGELLDVDFEVMSLMQLYRAGDVLMRHREVLEQAVCARVSELFGLDWTVTLYAPLAGVRSRITSSPTCSTSTTTCPSEPHPTALPASNAPCTSGRRR